LINVNIRSNNIRYWRLCLFMIFYLVSLFNPLLSQQPGFEIMLHTPPGFDLTLEDMWSLDIFNAGSEPIDAYLFGTVDEGDRGMMFRGRSQSFILSPGETTIHPDDIEDVYDTQFNEEFKSFIQRNARFPAGEYEICIEVRRQENDAMLGISCYNYFATLPGAPRLIAPLDEYLVIEIAPQFQWTTPVPLPPGTSVSYKIKVCEILTGQTPADAINSLPYFEDEVYMMNSLIYPLGAQDLTIGNRYVWQVQAVDDDGYPIGENYGKSELWSFIYGILPIEVEELIAYPSIVVTTTADSIFNHRENPDLPLSLREAILWANDHIGPDTIAFNIPSSESGFEVLGGVWLFRFNSELPGLTDNNTIIDGTIGDDLNSLPGRPDLGDCSRPKVELDGQGIGRGLFITGSQCQVKGLAVYGFNGEGIRIQGNGNQILCCHIGTNSAQDPNIGNKTGVSLRVNATNNKIGLPDEGNLISGNIDNGILLYGNVSNTSIEGNYIGVKSNGQSPLPNKTGISIENGANHNAVGGAGSRTNNFCNNGCNIISGNLEYGIRISESDLNTVVGCFIGLAKSGTMAVSNGLDGVLIAGSHKNRIGGGRTDLSNVISGNRDGIVIRRTAARKSIANRIEGNLIGTSSSAADKIGNLHRGIFITTASENNIIGGDTKAYGNVISGNTGAAIRLDTNARLNKIRNNWIGTNRDNAQLGNGQGVALYYDVQFNRVGGGPEWSNTIAYNLGDGIHVEGSGCKNNGLTGNSILLPTPQALHRCTDAHGEHPWLRIWEVNTLGGDQYYIVGQLDTVFYNNRIDIHSDNMDQGEFLEAFKITPGEERVR